MNTILRSLSFSLLCATAATAMDQGSNNENNPQPFAPRPVFSKKSPPPIAVPVPSKGILPAPGKPSYPLAYEDAWNPTKTSSVINDIEAKLQALEIQAQVTQSFLSRIENLEKKQNEMEQTLLALRTEVANLNAKFNLQTIMNRDIISTLYFLGNTSNLRHVLNAFIGEYNQNNAVINYIASKFPQAAHLMNFPLAAPFQQANIPGAGARLYMSPLAAPFQQANIPGAGGQYRR